MNDFIQKKESVDLDSVIGETHRTWNALVGSDSRPASPCVILAVSDSTTTPQWAPASYNSKRISNTFNVIGVYSIFSKNQVVCH